MKTWNNAMLLIQILILKNWFQMESNDNKSIKRCMYLHLLSTFNNNISSLIMRCSRSFVCYFILFFGDGVGGVGFFFIFLWFFFCLLLYGRVSTSWCLLLRIPNDRRLKSYKHLFSWLKVFNYIIKRHSVTL